MLIKILNVILDIFNLNKIAFNGNIFVYFSPNYFDIFTRTTLTCFDCIIEPKKFAKTLKCTQDA